MFAQLLVLYSCLIKTNERERVLTFNGLHGVVSQKIAAYDDRIDYISVAL
jgi:hypothetical protein